MLKNGWRRRGEKLRTYNRLLVTPLLDVKFRISTPIELGHGYFIWKKEFSIREDLKMWKDDNKRSLFSESLLENLEESKYWLIAHYESPELNIDDTDDIDDNVRNIAKMLLVLFRIVRLSRLFEYAQLTYTDGNGNRIISGIEYSFKSEVYAAEHELQTEYIYTDEDIEKTRKIFDNFYIHLVDGQVKEGRIQSSLLFLKIASETYYISVRLVNMSIALESIFSTSRHELKYRISQRVAFFLGNNSPNRTEIYKNMKTIYDLRSDVVHGGVLKKDKIEKLNEYLPLLEEYLKLSIIKILESSDLIDTFSDNLKIDEYFDRIILE
ncbi:MAG: hypothetical protein IH880_06320 [Candidatus Marinimicrobia bacterium]|nr:hypothetical protein [Candidatus Neomarinimicrobiota bacterium]